MKVWRTLFAAAEFISPGVAVATAFSGAGTVERVEERFESMLAVAESDVSAHEGSMSMMCVFNSMLTVDATIAQAKVRGDESFLTRREGPTLKSSEEAWVLAKRGRHPEMASTVLVRGWVPHSRMVRARRRLTSSLRPRS